MSSTSTILVMGLQFFLLVATTTIAAARNPTLAKEGEICMLNGTSCENGLTCVITRFDVQTSMGTCIKPKSPSVPCTVANCALYGEEIPCFLGHITTTCQSWARREDGGKKPNCRLPKCSKGCNVNFVDIFGKLHCNRCAYVAKSCRSGFTIPIANNLNKCDGGKCLEDGAKCVASRNGVRVNSCNPGSMCFVESIKSEKNARGICKRLGRFGALTWCSAPYCSRFGYWWGCMSREGGFFTTCGSWAKSQSGAGRKCRVHCKNPKLCNPQRPKYIDRRQYCNLCTFVKYSCKSGYQFTSSNNGQFMSVYGKPIPLPGTLY